MSQSDQSGETQPKLYFGPGLQYARETHLAAAQGGENSHAAMAQALGGAGYKISVVAYSEVEGSRALPHEAARFLGAVAAALDLSEREQGDLERRLAYDVLYARLGERARQLINPEDQGWEPGTAQPPEASLDDASWGPTGDVMSTEPKPEPEPSDS